MAIDIDIEKFFKKGDLIPAIVQEVGTGDVLMLAYMNRESMAKTIETGYTWFWSRSRQELWNKGATSGHVQRVVKMLGDCDDDTLLVIVEQMLMCHKETHKRLIDSSLLFRKFCFRTFFFNADML